MARPLQVKQEIAEDVMRRFLRRASAAPGDSCWPWHGERTHKGYGIMSVEGKHVRAHRVSWMLHRGPIPEGALVLHRCDKPPCVNPDHLFLGSNDDNVADRNTKGRQASGERVGGAKLTMEKAAAIRARFSAEITKAKALIQAEFGIGRATLYDVLRDRKWRHQPTVEHFSPSAGESALPPRSSPPPGSADSSSDSARAAAGQVIGCAIDHEFVPTPFYPDLCDRNLDEDGRRRRCGKPRRDHGLP